MEIIKENIASINHNDPNIDDRVNLSIALEVVDGETLFFIVTDTDEDTGPRFRTAEEAESAIFDMWGKSADWDLQYR